VDTLDMTNNIRKQLDEFVDEHKGIYPDKIMVSAWFIAAIEHEYIECFGFKPPNDLLLFDIPMEVSFDLNWNEFKFKMAIDN